MNIADKFNRFLEVALKKVGIFWTMLLIYPFFLIAFKKIEYIGYEEDRLDFHTFQHTWGATILTLILLLMGINVFYAFFFSLQVWVAYEVFFDGLRISDKRGYQLSDIGADFIGAIVPAILWLIFKGA